MTTTELFRKHFGNTAKVDLKHPNVESFFEELNAICLEEDRQKNFGNPMLADEGSDVNPYLLTGDELKRTEQFRKEGR
jgi:hypothetical protein